MPQEENSLVLDIFKEGARLKMSAFERSNIAQSVRHFSRIPFNLNQTNKLCKEIFSILNRADKRSLLDTNSLELLKKNGQLLWDHLLSKPVKEKLKNSTNTSLALCIDEELIDIPWEILFDGNQFLCLKFGLGRSIRTKSSPRLSRYRSSGSNAKMLVLANPTNDLKSAYSEGLYIKNKFSKKRPEVKIDLKTTNIDTFYVKRNLRDYDIVHFAGHCEFDEDNAINSGWVLADGRLDIQDITSLGESLEFPSLVFSNACYSARPNEDIKINCHSKAYGLVSAFLFSGVRHYIGTIRKIEDEMGFIFSNEFYFNLISSKPIGECMRRARLKLVDRFGLGAISWSNYILYGDANYCMFSSKQKKKAIFNTTKERFKKYKFKLMIVVTLITLLISVLKFLPTLNPSVYYLFLESAKSLKNGDNDKAIEIALKLIEKDPSFFESYKVLAKAYERAGRQKDALKYYFAYSAFSEKRNDYKRVADAFINIGWLYQSSGDFDKSLDFYQKAEEISASNKDLLNQAIVLRKMSVWYIDKEDYSKALELLTRSSSINLGRKYFKEHLYNLACDYFDIGLVFANKNDFVSAKDFYNKSKEIFLKMRQDLELSDCLFNLGEICVFDKEYQKALDYYMKGLKLDVSHNNKKNLASDYQMIAELYLEMGSFEESEKYYLDAFAISEKIDSPIDKAQASFSLAKFYKEKGKINKAREFLRIAQEIYRKTNLPALKEVKSALYNLDTQ